MCILSIKLYVKLLIVVYGCVKSKSSKMDIMELYHAMNSIHLLKPLLCKQCQKGRGYNNSNLKAHLNRPEWACSLQLHNTFICCAIRTGVIEVYTEMAAIPLVAAPIIGK